MPHTAACGRALGVIDLGPEACQYQVGCLAPSPSYMQPLMQLPAIWAGCCLPTHLFVWMPLHCVTNPPHNTCLLHSADEFKSQRHVYRTACVHDLLATEHVLLSNGCFVFSGGDGYLSLSPTAFSCHTPIAMLFLPILEVAKAHPNPARFTALCSTKPTLCSPGYLEGLHWHGPT
jgi:hypothetical protein